MKLFQIVDYSLNKKVKSHGTKGAYHLPTTPTMSAELSTSDQHGSDMRLSTLTVQQEKVLSILCLISGALSIAGSSTIAYKVLRNRREASPYDRLLLGLSLCDIVASFAYAMSPFLLPTNGGGQRVWAIGTDATCTSLGWLLQFSWSAILYNGALSFYYLATVRFGIRRKTFGRRFEPWIHGSILLFSFGTSTYGVVIGLFNELEFGCKCCYVIQRIL